MVRPRREVRKVVVERDSEDDVSSSEEEEEEEDEGEEEEEEVVDEAEDEDEEVRDNAQEDEEDSEAENHIEKAKELIAEENAKPRKRISISLKGTRVCKVCGGSDHQAGFVRTAYGNIGSVYADCPNKPCFLCKKPGHTTATCPHRIAPEHGVAAAPRRHKLGLLDFVHERQLRGHVAVVRLRPVVPNKVDCAIVKLHSRRVTYLEFHPTKDNILISGDKKGQLGIWDFEKVFDKTVYDTVHSCIINSIKFSPRNDDMIYTSASDGKVCHTDLETGLSSTILDLNPDGWTGPSTWKMMYAMDLNVTRSIVFAADNCGFLYQVDMRTNKTVAKPLQVHNKGTKVVGMHCNPIDPDVFLTCGNDHVARIWDTRLLEDSGDLAQLVHPRVVNSAYFSPITGNKILTTCQDNRIRVWDCIFGDLTQPSREIVHSHDFNRYLTPFRAEWDPKDPTECLAVIGRYISDDFNGVALHPIDFIDISTGKLVAEVVDRNITTISPVNKLHPRLDVLGTGSSRSLFIWRPDEEPEPEVDHIDERKSKREVITYQAGEGDDAKRKKGKKHVDVDDDYCKMKRKTTKPSKMARKGKKPTDYEEDEEDEFSTLKSKSTKPKPKPGRHRRS